MIFSIRTGAYAPRRAVRSLMRTRSCGRVVTLFLLPGTAAAQVQFVDVTDGSGVQYSGESYGGAGAMPSPNVS